MLFADTMAIFFVIVGLLITFPSLWLLCSALWPEFVQLNCQAVERGVLKSFLIGIPVTALGVLLTVVIGKLPASLGQIGGILTFSLLMVFAQAGVAGLATHIGRKLKSPADLDRPWKATLRGGIVLVLSYLLPLVGWFLILPASIIIGAGSSIRACFSRKKAANQKGNESAGTTASTAATNNGAGRNGEHSVAVESIADAPVKDSADTPVKKL